MDMVRVKVGSETGLAFRRFWVKVPRHFKKTFYQKGATSIVERIVSCVVLVGQASWVGSVT